MPSSHLKVPIEYCRIRQCLPWQKSLCDRAIRIAVLLSNLKSLNKYVKCLQIACILTCNYTVYLNSNQKLLWRKPVKLWQYSFKVKRELAKFSVRPPLCKTLGTRPQAIKNLPSITFRYAVCSSCPRLFDTRQVYLPACFSSTRTIKQSWPAVVLRKRAVLLIFLLSFSHTKVGGGLPLAMHSKTTLFPIFTVWLFIFLIIRGISAVKWIKIRALRGCSFMQWSIILNSLMIKSWFFSNVLILNCITK